ncbi:MAG TPA: glycosyltransferase family 2 protein, partial [Terriglobales bacterium]|nr:glycosyltransferase family 2 protein [Terriglobales bacterium]
MDLSPLVSVIIIFFNAEPFLNEAIHSVLEQDYPNWELLLVDDGSSDGSTRIALNFVHHIPQQV